MSEKLSWKETAIADKIKLSLSVILIFASIVLGFLSFLWLQYIPTSVLGIDTMWISSALGLLGLSAYVSQKANELDVIVKSKVKDLELEQEKIKKYERKRDLEETQ